MEERSKLISKLRDSLEYRTAYVKAKLGILVPSQIRALRLQSEMPRQADLAKAANMLQSRISMIETPGAANVTLETLARLAAAFRVGLVVKFVPFSEMLRWENSYSQDNFPVTKIENDEEFENPTAARGVSAKPINQTAAEYQLGATLVTPTQKIPSFTESSVTTTPYLAAGSKKLAGSDAAPATPVQGYQQAI